MASSTAAAMDNRLSVSGILNGMFCPNHLHVLMSLTSDLRGQEYRDNVDEETFRVLQKVLSKLCNELQAFAGDPEGLPYLSQCLQITTECFRTQRNACVQSPRNQGYLREFGFIEESIKVLTLLQNLHLENKDSIFESLRCGIQFLGNLAVGNQACKDDIWKLSFQDVLMNLLSVNDDKAVSHAAMVVHTCLDQAKVEQLARPENIGLALRVMELCRTQPDLDWTVLTATQHFLKSLSLVESMYTLSSPLERITLLELLSAQLGEGDPKECGIPPGVAGFLARCFQEGCGAVLALASGSAAGDEEALTVISLLDVLCEMTSDHKQFMFLQGHPGLLKTTVELLEQVHDLGKASKNAFSSAQDFSSFSNCGDTSSLSPSVSFKAHLIRLIGNLSHRNAGNQNQVRDLDGIPLILDNCSIDSNNPFISQWAIFAIRNLLERNKENQELVAVMERQGTADYSALKELGFQVEERDGGLLLKTVKKDARNPPGGL